MTAIEEEAGRPVDAAVKRVLVENHREFLRFLEHRVGRRDVAQDTFKRPSQAGRGVVRDLRRARLLELHVRTEGSPGERGRSAPVNDELQRARGRVP